jgi:2-phospho-L-lactate transferase/gluconeogenesis factor (CofD/UPF0052 family)
MAIYRIILGDVDLGQVIDALENRAQSWETTAEHIRSGNKSQEEEFVVEECSGEREAEHIAKHYQQIIQKIRAQVLTQSRIMDAETSRERVQNEKSTAFQR